MTDMLVHATFDRPRVAGMLPALRHLLVHLQAPEAPRSAAPPPAPLNLALVVDASGSMHGLPLQIATSAACDVVRRLGPEDRFSLVSFADDVIVHVDGVAADDAGQRDAFRALDELRTRGTTDLGAGWLRGAECVARLAERRGVPRNHVVVLSDGHANRGITDPTALSTHARELRKRGVYSTCVGIGEGYSTTQLEAIAEHGGGRMHHAAGPQEIAEILLGELKELRETTAQDVEVEIGLPGCVRSAELTSLYAHEIGADRAVVTVGSIESGAARDVVLSMLVDPAAVGAVIELPIVVRWSAPDGAPDRRTVEAAARLSPADGVHEAELERDVPVSVRVAEAWLANITRRVLDWNRRGLFDDLRRYLDAQRGAFTEHCRALPGAERFVADLRRLERHAARPIRERVRKEGEVQALKRSKGQIDKRASAPADWMEGID